MPITGYRGEVGMIATVFLWEISFTKLFCLSELAGGGVLAYHF